MTTRIHQLLGHDFKRLVRPYEMYSGSNWLQFMFDGCEEATQCVITWDTETTYSMQFYLKVMWDTTKLSKIEMVRGIGQDKLGGAFEKATGIVTRWED